ncbi:MAG: DUF1080 domain-containing protein [Armatimonadetes bacterium]|nr:DUF1080 domain-containing protein [Armatimonadota bacterium]
MKCVLVAIAAFAMLGADDQGFKPIFNSHDLKRWNVMGDKTWSVEKGELICSPGGKGWLRTDDQYGDFALRLEYKLAEGAQSGVYFRCHEAFDPALTGFKVHLVDDAGGDRTRTSTGAISSHVLPLVSAAKPAGQWNQLEIVAKGVHIKVTINGKAAQDFRIDNRELSQGLPNGRQLYARVSYGYIGLENAGGEARFRNIRLKRLID